MSEKTKKRSSLGPAFGILAIAFLLGVVIQQVLGKAGLEGPGGQRIPFVVAGLIAFTLTVAAGFKKEWHKFLASNRFAVPSLLVLTFLSVLGTLILQAQPQAAFDRAYGGAAMVIQGLFLDDLFHSLAFSIILGLGAGGLALTVARKRKLTLRYVGSLGAHLGMLLLLAGAAVGNVWVVKGRLNMKVGQTSDHFFVRAGSRMQQFPLGFEVKLDEFKLEHYDAEYRLMVFAIQGEKEQRLASIDPTSDKAKAQLAEYGIELLNYWPDHVRKTVVEALPGGTPASPKSPAALAFELDGATTWLFDDGRPTGAVAQVAGKRLVFFHDEARALAFAEGMSKTKAGPAHLIVVDGQEIPAEAGKTIALPGGKRKLSVANAFTDFVMDAQTKKPSNRSDKPNNPAIEVVVTDEAGKELAHSFLFAKFPDFAHEGQDSPLAGVRYKYAGAASASAIDGIAVAQAGQYWAVKDGQLAEKNPLAVGSAIQLGPKSVNVTALHEACKRSFVDENASDEAKNPVAQIRLSKAGAGRQIRAKQPVRLGSGRALVMAPKGGESVSDYLSTVSVWKDGKKIKTETVEVNYPLEYEGFVFYQADYRPDDPTFSGFQVVRDSGLWIVYLGLFTNMAGVLLAVVIPPLLRRRRKMAEAEGGAS